MESNTNTNDLLIFDDDNDLLGIKDIPNCDVISKHKTYYELEKELEEVKSILIQLQKQMVTILEMPKQIETTYIYSLNNKMEIITTNCEIITFIYKGPEWVNGAANSNSGFVIDIDKVTLKNYDFNNVDKFLQTFKNIHQINIDIVFPISTGQVITATTPPTNYFMQHFNVIKNIVKFNNNINIKINCNVLTFPFNWLEDIFEDIVIENIETIKISYQNREDTQNTRIIKQVIKNLDKCVTDKFILDVMELTIR